MFDYIQDYIQDFDNDLYNKHLLDFLKIWKEDIESKRPRLEFKMDGICANYADYIHKETNKKVSRINAFEFLTEKYFRKFSNSSTPFNSGLTAGRTPYFLECNHQECHLNKQRIKWVNETIIELEGKQDGK